MDVVWIIVVIALAVIQILMIIKFFQIAKDVRRLRLRSDGVSSDNEIDREVDRLLFIGKTKEAMEVLLNLKFSLLQEKESVSKYYPDEAIEIDRKLKAIDSKLSQIND